MTAAPTQAAGDEYEKYPVNLKQKLGAGLVNTATGWVELAKTRIVVSKENGLAMDLAAGLTKGIVNTIGRTWWRVFGVVTFILLAEPMIEPHMICQDFDMETGYHGEFETYKES